MTRFLSLCLLLASATASAAAGAGPEPPLLLRRWSMAEGLPQGSINDVVVAADGRLWLATFGGLASFDGASFRVFDSATLEGLPSNQITALAPAEDGSLWVGTMRDGIVQLAHERIERTVPAARPDAELVALLRTGAGTLLERESNGALRRWDGGRWTEIVRPGIAATRQSQYRDGDGAVWAADDRRLLRLDGRGAIVASWPSMAPIVSLGAGPDARPWLGLLDGVARLTPQGIERLRVTPPIPGAVTALLAEGPDSVLASTAEGRLWPLSRRAAGAVWARGSPLVELPPGGEFRSLARDPERNLWVGTNGQGLLGLHPARIALLRLGERRAAATALVTDGAHGAWAAFGCDGLAHVAGASGPVAPVALPPAVAGNACVQSLLRDTAGRLWIGQGDRVLRQDAGGAIRPLEPLRPTALTGPMAQGATGVWIGSLDGRLVRLDGREEIVEELHVGSPIVSLVAGAGGTVWIGTTGALVRHDPRGTRRWGRAQGIVAGEVRDVLPEADGTVWIASYGGGLGLLSQGRFAWVTRRHGLPDDSVTRILKDGRGRLWLLTNRGIAVATERELTAAALGRRPSVDFVVYGQEAGMAEGNFGYPAGFRSGDGTIWFDSIEGVATLDAAGFPFRRTVPRPTIDRVVADGTELARADPVVVPSGVDRLRIDYSTVTFVAPEEMRFNHRLAGFDRDWTGASGSRQANYTRLPPGDFTFELLERNEDGVWATEPRSLRLRVLPAWWQTVEARLGFALAAIGLAAAVHALRAGAIRRRGEALLRESEARRTAEETASHLRIELEHLQRISTAGELAASLAHEINQPLSAIVTNAAAGSRLVDAGQPRGDLLHEILGDIAAQGHRASQVTQRMRAFLRKGEPVRQPVDLSELVRSTRPLLRREIAEQFQAADFALATDLPPVDADRTQLQQVLVNLLKNACEAMTLWPGERRLTVTTAREGASVLLAVQDSGPGLPPEVGGRLFAPFVTTKPEGMGLGLAICKSLVEVNGGRIVHERPLAGGALFRIRLPVADGERGPG